LNGCEVEPVTDVLTKDDAMMKVTRSMHRGGRDGAEVGLITIEGGGHTWPGQKSPVGFIGKSTSDISANELIWEFFTRHPMK
jgi:polyhydroxybutyrate depolymerase